MTCRTCGAPDPAEQLEHDALLIAATVARCRREFAAGEYRTGYRNGRRDLIEQQLAEKLQPSAVTARWKRNAHRAWMNDCVCAECAGTPLDGWCTCIYCQQLGWVGEQVLRHGHAPIYRPLAERRHTPWEEVNTRDRAA